MHQKHRTPDLSNHLFFPSPPHYIGYVFSSQIQRLNSVDNIILFSGNYIVRRMNSIDIIADKKKTKNNLREDKKLRKKRLKSI